jgi:hypothetical protein
MGIRVVHGYVTWNSTGQLKFHFKFVYNESLQDYLTTSKGLICASKTLIAIRAYQQRHSKYKSVEMHFAFLTKETALLFDANHGRQVSNKI